MKLNLNFKNSPLNLDLKHVKDMAAVLWKKIHTLLFFSFLLCMIGLGGYIWQRNVSGSGWSEEKKQEYLNTQNKRTIFRESDFRKAIEGTQKRKNNISEDYQGVRDIFKSY